ncbi:MAG: anhydro-N-acetylmuramic acid kinase [Burkholderiales bacterium]
MTTTRRFLGIMSGSSADGVDVVLTEVEPGNFRVIQSHYAEFPHRLRQRILSLQTPSTDELETAARLAADLSRGYAEAIRAVLGASGFRRQDIRAIGCHGQTVRHNPQSGYSIQLVNGALLAELSGISVVCDFRNRDIAAGGEGAPLVPAFHRAVFSSSELNRVIANIGGIANLTSLQHDGYVAGFDTGPGNVLLDGWAEKHLGRRMDEGGIWAQSGRVISSLLDRLLAHPYFARIPPKSTGRETFNLDWLARNLSGTERPEDVQATLLTLTSKTIADAVRDHCQAADEIYVCGGGAHNTALMSALIEELEPIPIRSTEVLAIGPDWVEACAFAWLAYKAIHAEFGNLPAVTGARGERILGAIYPA